MVANGEDIFSEESCNGVHLQLQQLSLHVNFYVLPLGGCEVILRSEWLDTLDVIHWHYRQRRIEFNWKGEDYVLQGLTSEQITIPEAGKEGKEIKKRKMLYMIQVKSHLAAANEEGTKAKPEMHPDMEILIHKYDSIF